MKKKTIVMLVCGFSAVIYGQTGMKVLLRLMLCRWHRMCCRIALQWRDAIAAPADSASTAMPADTAQPAATAKKDSATARTTIRTLDKMVVTATRTTAASPRPPPASASFPRGHRGVAGAQYRRPGDGGDVGEHPPCRGIGEGIPSDINMRGIPGAWPRRARLSSSTASPRTRRARRFLSSTRSRSKRWSVWEIVRGPYSSLYGANALSGVVNVITKTGDGRPGVQDVVENQLSVQPGA